MYKPTGKKYLLAPPVEPGDDKKKAGRGSRIDFWSSWVAGKNRSPGSFDMNLRTIAKQLVLGVFCSTKYADFLGFLLFIKG
jgi:hypothetical protein